MKRHYIVFVLCIVFPAVLLAAPICLNQSFSSSTTVSDYTSSTPDSGQFNSIESGSGDTFSIVGSALQLNKGAAVNSMINRTTALTSSPLTLFCFQMVVNFTFTNQTASTSLGYIDLYDSGYNEVWGSFGFQIASTGADNTWRVSGGAGSFIGEQTVRVYVNDTGMNRRYEDPNGAMRLLTNTYMDIWVNTNLVKTCIPPNLNTANDINGFRIVSPDNGVISGTFTYDDFCIWEMSDILFDQEFSSSATLGDYSSTAPDAGKFNSILAGSGDTFSIAGSALQLSKGAAVASTVNRTTALTSSPLTLFCYQMDVDFLFTNQSASTSLGFVELYDDGPTTVWGTFGFQVASSGADNTWRVSGGTGSYTGMQTVKAYVNDTGRDRNYTDPTGIMRTLSNTYVDVWVDTNLVRSTVAVHLNTTNDINGFRIVSPANGVISGTFTYDNFLIDADLSDPGTLILTNDFSIGEQQAMPCEAIYPGQTFEPVDYSAFDAVEWRALLTEPANSESPLYTDLKSSDFIVQFPTNAEVTLHWNNGSHADITDFQPYTDLLHFGYPFTLESFGGRSSDGVMPYFNLASDGGGLIVAVGWPGDWKAVFESLGDGRVRITTGLQETCFRLSADEAVRLPSTLVMSYEGDWIDGQNKFRSLMLEHFTPTSHEPMDLVPVAKTAGGSAVINEITDDELITLAEDVADLKLPLDTFWIDAGWNEGGFPDNTGNPDADPVRFPDGLAPVGAAVSNANMRFLVWFEPERAMTGTWLDTEHSDWLLAPSDTPDELSYMENNGFRLLDLGNTNALAWALDTVSQDIEDAGIDIYRQDFNEYPSFFWHNGEASDEVGLREIRHINGLYDFLDGLTNYHPNLVIDNCASGGRRLDFEMMRRSVVLWRSDCSWGDTTFPRNVQLQTHGLSLWLPLHGLGANGTNDYRFRSGMGACASYALNLYNANIVTSLRRYLELYLPVRRLFTADYYPLTDWTDDTTEWLAFQFHDPNTDEGLVQAFCGSDATERTYTVKFSGLDPVQRYVVESWDDLSNPIERFGEDLMDQGIELTAGSGEGALILHYSPAETEQVYFSQDFASSTNVDDYVHATLPGTNQFNSISPGSGDSFSIVGNALRLNKGAAVTTTINRSRELDNTPLTLFCYQMDVGFSFTNQIAGKSLGYVDFYESGPTEIWGTFGFQVAPSGADNTWRVSGGTGSFTGVQTVRAYINDTGIDRTYVDPADTVRTIGDTYIDVWVGTNLVRSFIPPNLNTGNDIDGFRIVFPLNNGIASGMYTLDNFLIREISDLAYFDQNFSNSTTLGDYTSSTPDFHQFNSISAGSGDSFSIVSNALQLSKGAAIASTINRSRALGSSPLTFFCFRADVNFSFTGQTADKSLGFLELYDDSPTTRWGSPFNIQVATGDDNVWKIAGGTGSYTGMQTVRVYVNDTGTNKIYTGPDNVVRTLTNTYADVWVSNSLVKSTVTPNLNTANDINGFRIVFPANGATSGTFTYDNLLVEAIREFGVGSGEFTMEPESSGFLFLIRSQ